MKKLFTQVADDQPRKCRYRLYLVLLFSCLLGMYDGVQAQAPNWALEHANYQHSLTVVASLKVDGILSTSANDMLAAFVGSEVRGVASPDVFIQATGHYLAFLQVYSNVVSGEQITFKIYRSATDTVYEAVNEIAFQSNLSIGANTGPYVITDNYGPTDIILSATTIAENNATNRLVATLLTVSQDASDVFTYSLPSGGADDNNAFAINDNELRTVISFDYETKNAYTLRVRSDDASNEYVKKVFTLRIADGNDTPTAIQISPSTLPEDAVVGTSFAVLSSTDQDLQDTHTYRLVVGAGDAENASFAVLGNQLVTNATFDFETKANYNVLLESSDASGAVYSEVITVTITDVNDAPNDVMLSETFVAEDAADGHVVATLSAVDADAQDAHTYVLLNHDEGVFRMQGDRLVLRAPLDYERQAAYAFDIRAVDQAGLGYQKRFILAVQDVNEPPTLTTLSSSSMRENASASVPLGYFITQDQDISGSFAYALVGGGGSEDNDAFIILGNSLYANASLDYEEKSSYRIRVATIDQGGDRLESALVLSVEDVNEGPTDITISIRSVGQNDSIGTEIAVLSAVDEDESEFHSYAMASGEGDDHNALFLIEGDRVRLLQPFGDVLASPYSMRVSVFDKVGFSFEKFFTFSVQAESVLAPAITLSNQQIPEGSAYGTLIGAFSTSSLTGDVTYQMEGGSDRFSITGANLRLQSSLNYEEQIFYAMTVRATNASNNTVAQDFIISLSNENEAPNRLDWVGSAIREDAPPDSIIGYFVVGDPDYTDYAGVLRLQLMPPGAGNDNDFFVLVGKKLKNKILLDFERKNRYLVQVAVEDTGGLSYERFFFVDVEDVVEPPTRLDLSNLLVRENTLEGAFVGQFTVLDASLDTTLRYFLVPGDTPNDNQSFYLSGNRLLTRGVFDYEKKRSYTIDIRVQDQVGGALEERFVIGVNDINDPPSNLLLSAYSVAENNAAGTQIGTFIVVDEDQYPGTFSYTISSASDFSAFTIRDGALWTNKVFDYEQQSVYTVLVTVRDGDGYQLTQNLSIDIGDVNDVPSGIRLSQTEIKENNEINSIVGTFEIIDQDDETAIYTLVGGTGGENNASFFLSGNRLQAQTVFDYEGKNDYTIRVRATDAAGLFVENAFLLSVMNANEPPTTILAKWRDFREDLPVGSFLGSLSAQDDDLGDIFFYRFGDDLAVRKVFEVRGFEVYLLQPLDFERQDSYTIPIKATDQSGKSLERSFMLPVIDVNEPPLLLFEELSVPENSLQGAKIGTIRAEDPDENQTVSYSIVPDESTLRVLDRFYIHPQKGELFLAKGHFLDYETKSIYHVLVKAEDDQELPLSTTRLYSINVLNVPEKELPVNLVITPNNDGINDFWVIHGIEEHYNNLSLTIFSGFGQVVFQRSHYRNNWDGTYKGNPLPTGVYYYILKESSGKVLYKGSISVLN